MIRSELLRAWQCLSRPDRVLVLVAAVGVAAAVWSLVVLWLGLGGIGS
jgi:hypothetical protein